MNNKEKESFFAQYYLQPIVSSDSHEKSGLHPLKCLGGAHRIEGCYLLLKDLSAISDEDAMEGAKIVSSWDENAPLDWEDFEEWLYEILNNNSITFADYVSGYQMLQVLDFLRSRGYLLPFRQFSCDDLISMGWVKIENNKL